MYYVKTEQVAGRRPYVIWNQLDEVWRGTRGAIYCVSDTWVYKFEPYKMVAKVRCLRPGRFILRVTHSDGKEEALLDESVYPGKFYDKTFSLNGGSAVGDEVIEFLFNPKVLGTGEKYQFNIPVLAYPTTIVIRREGIVAGRVDETTRTLPAVRKLTSLGVLGEYEGYERTLRSIFSEYTLMFGEELGRNLVLNPTNGVSSIIYNGNLTLNGDIGKIIPLTLIFKDYLRSQETFGHKATVLGGGEKVIL